jgi:predicted O-methyltransferase YrrM
MLESKQENAKIAEANIANSGFEDVVEVKCCPTLEALQQVASKENAPVFEMVFIDADQDNSIYYLQYVLKWIVCCTTQEPSALSI